mgnify:CR=1 FL=1
MNNTNNGIQANNGFTILSEKTMSNSVASSNRKKKKKKRPGSYGR